MTSKEKIDLLLQLTQATIHLPKISTVRERGKDGRMTDSPKISGSVELSLFQENDLMLFRNMLYKEVMEIFPQVKAENTENTNQLQLPLTTEEDNQQDQK